MHSGLLSFFIPIILSLSQAWCTNPNIFVPVSYATCQPEYAWMNNAEQRSPCLMVAYVIAACVGDTWTQPALPSGYSYNSPNGTTATPCYCSWSCYNLMMACTLCQNPAYTSEMTTWPSFSQGCPLSYKGQMFPQGYVLADNASIPYWATINPETWSSELFNIEQAESYANQNQSDYWPSSSTSGSSSSSSSSSSISGSGTNVGAIIGGTVGGAVGLVLILIGGYILYKRQQRPRPQSGEMPILHTDSDTPIGNAHARWAVEPSTHISSPPNMALPMIQTTSQPQGIVLPPSTPAPTETASFVTIGNNAAHTRAIPMV